MLHKTTNYPQTSTAYFISKLINFQTLHKTFKKYIDIQQQSEVLDTILNPSAIYNDIEIQAIAKKTEVYPLKSIKIKLYIQMRSVLLACSSIQSFMCITPFKKLLL